MNNKTNKMFNLNRLHILLQSSEGYTIKKLQEKLENEGVSVCKRTVLAYLKELEDVYGAKFIPIDSKERIWKYEKMADLGMSCPKNKELEAIRKCINDLKLFNNDPLCNLLRYYLICLEQGLLQMTIPKKRCHI